MPLKGKMSDRIVRKWYLKHDAMIPSLVDSHFLIEELAILDVLKTETKTRKSVSKFLGLE